MDTPIILLFNIYSASKRILFFLFFYAFLFFLLSYLGVHIHRGCSMIHDVRHECDPPASTVDLEKTLDFFCSRTCPYDGCNQHTVSEISSNTNGCLYNKVKSYLTYIFFIFVLLFFC